MLRSLIVLLLAAASLREGPYRVEKVSDGDTIAVRRGNSRELVRLIGVDAPEIEGPYRRAEKGGVESRIELEKLLQGKQVILEFDAQQGLRDQHGRLLAFVYTGNVQVNREQISRGYALAYRKFKHAHREEFIRLENEARARKRGLWKNGTP